MAGVSAQTNTGEISGVVADSSGGVLPGASVVARHPATGFTSERVTDADGRFFLPALPTGDWEISAELAGFRRVTLTGVVLQIGRTVELEFGLSLDTLSEEEQLTYQRLIEEEDQDLLVWLMHREWPEDPDLRHLVQMIVEHAETTDSTAYRTL